MCLNLFYYYYYTHTTMDDNDLLTLPYRLQYFKIGIQGSINYVNVSVHMHTVGKRRTRN